MHGSFEITCFVYLLISASTVSSRNINEVAEKIHGDVPGEISLDNKFLLDQVSTIVSSEVVTEIPETLTVSLVTEDSHDNGIKDFRPSVHLGEIEEPRTRSNPFNNVQHVAFEDTLGGGAYGSFLVHQTNHEDSSQDVSQRESPKGGRVKFEDDSTSFVLENPRILFNENSRKHQAQSYGQFMATQQDDQRAKKSFFDHLFFNERPTNQRVHEVPSIVLEKPTRFQEDQSGYSYFDISKIPYMISGYLNPNNQDYRPPQQEVTYQTVQKPYDQMYYLAQQQQGHDPSVTNTRKYPYQYPYQYPMGYQYEFMGDPHLMAHMAKRQKMSPWKKIIQLIGTFLPLGLLLAALTPNVVQIDNTTQPNIVLSKLRVDDQAAEHKQARTVEEMCEERSICEMIVAGGKPRSNLLQNVLWNLATRTTEETAKANDLQEIFVAVKKKDCGTISC